MSRRDKDSGGSGWTWALGLGAAAVAGAAYVGKKLYDEYQEQKEKEEKLKYAQSIDGAAASGFSGTNPWTVTKKVCHDDQASGNNTSNNTRKRVVENSSAPKSSPPQTPTECETRSEEVPLQNALQQYYDSYVHVLHHKLSRAQNAVDYIKDHVMSYLKCNSKLRVVRLVDSGSTADGLVVINADEFDVEIHVDHNQCDFDLDTDDDVPGFALVKVKQSCAPLEGLTDVDQDNESASNLSPRKVCRYFQSQINQAIESIDRFNVQGSNSDDLLKIKVDLKESHLYINFIPVITLGGQKVVARPHPKLARDEKDVGYAQHWRLSFSRKERAMIDELAPGSCHIKLLKIMKAIRENSPSQLGMFSSYVFKTVFLHMLNDSFPEEWAEDQLPERFIDFIKRFEEYLAHRCLPHMFIPELNLFEELQPRALENAKLFLQKKISQSRLEALLKKETIKN